MFAQTISFCIDTQTHTPHFFDSHRLSLIKGWRSADDMSGLEIHVSAGEETQTCTYTCSYTKINTVTMEPLHATGRKCDKYPNSLKNQALGAALYIVLSHIPPRFRADQPKYHNV